MKESPWEGGVRGVAAVWSPLLHSSQRVSNQLMHIADWLPTFYAAAGTHGYYTAHTVHDKLTSLLKLVLGCNNM